MRKVLYKEISKRTRDICLQAAFELPSEVKDALRKAASGESNKRAENILDQCVLNAEIASLENMAICQDTGAAVFFIEIGDQVFIEGGNIKDAVNEGMTAAYKEGCLRKSMVDDPVFIRKNTGSNFPAVIHIDIVEGDKIRILHGPKGGGSENMSAVKMLKPLEGEEGIIDFVSSTVISAGGNPCPPVIVGVGIGGTFEKAALLAKKALFRPLDSNNPDPLYDELENKILKRINDSGVGPQGLGGKTTALKVKILHFPCHIASLPVAVNLNCHAARHAEIEI
ncbi:MAG: fumarate hydratase [Fibrobacterota bacterium]